MTLDLTSATDPADHDIERRLGDAFASGPPPASGRFIDERVARAMASEAERRMRGQRPLALPSSFRLRGSMALALGALLIVGSVSVVGAIQYLGEWGPLGHPATVGTIENEIASTIASTPLPPGYQYPVEAIRTLAEPAGNLTLYGGVQAVQFHAMCAWTAYWLDGFHASNKAQMSVATTTIATFPSWQAVSDPRLADDSVRNQVAQVISGARSGDPAPVQLLYDGMTCATALSR